MSLKGYKHGEIGGGHQRCQNGTSGFTLDEIAKELNMSKCNLQRALRIERNLTDSMKELLDVDGKVQIIAYSKLTKTIGFISSVSSMRWCYNGEKSLILQGF